MSGERTTAVIKRYLGEIAGDSPPSRSSRDLLDRAVRDCTDGSQNGRAARPPGPGPAAPTPPGSQDRPASGRLTPRPPGSPARPSSQAGLPLRTVPAHNGGDGQRHQDQRSRLGDRIDLDEERPPRGPDLPGRPAIIAHRIIREVRLGRIRVGPPVNSGRVGPGREQGEPLGRVRIEEHVRVGREGHVGEVARPGRDRRHGEGGQDGAAGQPAAIIRQQLRGRSERPRGFA